MEEQIPQQESPGLFDDEVYHEPASTGQRFVNWIVDLIFMRFTLTYLTARAVGYLIGTYFPEYAMKVAFGERSPEDTLFIASLIVMVNYLIYYPLCEKAFRGYTVGKLLSGTRAIREDGKELTFRDAILRSLVRLVPFEAFSGFGIKPWHDQWTRTKVIKAR